MLFPSEAHIDKIIKVYLMFLHPHIKHLPADQPRFEIISVNIGAQDICGRSIIQRNHQRLFGDQPAQLPGDLCLVGFLLLYMLSLNLPKTGYPTLTVFT